jgi:hypothetical protein
VVKVTSLSPQPDRSQQYGISPGAPPAPAVSTPGFLTRFAPAEAGCGAPSSSAPVSAVTAARAVVRRCDVRSALTGPPHCRRGRRRSSGCPHARCGPYGPYARCAPNSPSRRSLLRQVHERLRPREPQHERRQQGESPWRRQHAHPELGRRTVRSAVSAASDRRWRAARTGPTRSAPVPVLPAVCCGSSSTSISRKFHSDTELVGHAPPPPGSASRRPSGPYSASEIRYEAGEPRSARRRSSGRPARPSAARPDGAGTACPPSPSTWTRPRTGHWKTNGTSAGLARAGTVPPVPAGSCSRAACSAVRGDGGAPDREEAAHRVADPAQSAREESPWSARSRRATRRRGSRPPDPARLPLSSVAAGDDEVRRDPRSPAATRSGMRDGRMLEVGVHDDDPVGARSLDALRPRRRRGRPPGSPGGSRSTGKGQSCAAALITSGVSSVESSTKRTSQGSLAGTASVSWRSNSLTFADSLKVGMMTVTAPGSATAVASSRASPSTPPTGPAEWPVRPGRPGSPVPGAGGTLIARLPRFARLRRLARCPRLARLRRLARCPRLARLPHFARLPQFPRSA